MDFETARPIVTGIMLLFAALEIARGGFWHRGVATRRDTILDAVSSAVLPLMMVPAVLAVAPAIGEAIRPGSQGWLAWLPGWAMFGILLLGDDLTQYGWHRLSHRWLWLFGLHRAHHSAPYMSVRIVYRNNLVYYLLMPGIWISALLVYWGFGDVYGLYLVLKMAVIVGAHSDQAWDAPLYRRLPRLMWVVERLISTPATHSAHHGLREADGVTHYDGNFGNFLFLWDVLFGTAHITRRRPTEFGLEGLAPVGVVRELLLPAAVTRVPVQGGGRDIDRARAPDIPGRPGTAATPPSPEPPCP